MKLAAAHAIAGLVEHPTAQEIVPSVFAPGVADAVAEAVSAVHGRGSVAAVDSHR
jgi:malate dehydrogenase (oxaloacetate-decarboxylating)